MASLSLCDVPHEVNVGGELAVPGLAQVRLDVDEPHRARQPAYLASTTHQEAASTHRKRLNSERDAQCTPLALFCSVQSSDDDGKPSRARVQNIELERAPKKEEETDDSKRSTFRRTTNTIMAPPLRLP